jgi:hypothetical protein
MVSIDSQRSPLSAAIPQSITIEDVAMTTEPSHRPSRPPGSTAEHRLRRG